MTLDKSDLRRTILTKPRQFQEGLDAIGRIVPLTTDFKSIVVSGMGGSALPANLLDIYLRDLYEKDPKQEQLRLYNSRSYTLPVEAYDHCLNIICSHSGNTEETLSSLNEAIDHNLLCVGISSGGKLEETCKENDIPHIKLPIPYENFQPRVATGHFLAILIQLLVNAKKIPSCQNSFSSVAKSLEEEIPRLEERGKKIAEGLVGKTPVIYASRRFRALAKIWKIKINENSKTPAFWNYFPELNHNEFVGYTNPQSQFHIIELRDANGHPQNIKRYEVTARLLKARGVEVEVIDMPKGDILYRIFATLALGNWTSYHLALAYGQDPTPVAMVEDFKKELK